MCVLSQLFLLCYFNHPATSEIYTLSLHDALPISRCCSTKSPDWPTGSAPRGASRMPSPCPFRSKARISSRRRGRSEEHTSELQSHSDLVCRLLLEKKNDGEGTQFVGPALGRPHDH